MRHHVKIASQSLKVISELYNEYLNGGLQQYKPGYGDTELADKKIIKFGRSNEDLTIDDAKNAYNEMLYRENRKLDYLSHLEEVIFGKAANLWKTLTEDKAVKEELKSKAPCLIILATNWNGNAVLTLQDIKDIYDAYQIYEPIRYAHLSVAA